MKEEVEMEILCELSRTWMGIYLRAQPRGLVGDLTVKPSLLCCVSALHRAAVTDQDIHISSLPNLPPSDGVDDVLCSICFEGCYMLP